MAVILHQHPHPDRHVATDLLLRVAAVALAVAGILGLLPFLAQLA